MKPELSVVVVGDGAGRLRPLLAALHAQTAKSSMELVVVAPAAEHETIGEVLPSGLAGFQFVDRTPLTAFAPAKADAVRAAHADVVVFTETHAFPSPGWAAALIAAHRHERCAAVGPELVNANPRPLSNANMLLDYGPFLADGQRDAYEVLDLPGHNSSYRRELLLGYGEHLTQLLGFEAELHAQLRRRGERMVLEPRARLSHVNVTRLSSWLPERWHAGRIYAGALSRRWPRRRRLFYALASPAIPLLRVRRALGDATRTGERAVGRALPFLCFGLLAQSAGEAYGYVRGPGSMTQLFDMELRRLDYLAADDPMRASAADGRTPR